MTSCDLLGQYRKCIVNRSLHDVGSLIRFLWYTEISEARIPAISKTRLPDKEISCVSNIFRVAYHGGSSHFFGIGISRYQIQPVSVFFGRYCCTASFGRNTFLRFRGNFFLKDSAGIPFCLQKEDEVYKKGAEAPRGLPPFVLGAPAKVLIPKKTIEIFSGIGFGKPRNTDRYQPKNTDLDNSSIFG